MKNIRKYLSFALLTCAFPAYAQVANVTPTDLTTSGVNLTTGLATAPSTSLYVNNDGNTMLVIKTGTTAISVTIRANGSQICGAGYGCITPSDVAVNQPINTIEAYGPFPKGRYDIAGFDTVRVDLTATTQVSATPVRVPR